MRKALLLLVGFSISISVYCQSGNGRFLKELPARQLLKDSSWVLTPRLEAREIQYLDHNGKKVVAQILKARLKKGRLVLEAATPDNEDQFGRQVVTAEIEAENSPGRQVLAGVNADFFNMKNGTPQGPVVKEGRVIKGPGEMTGAFVGVLNSGRIILGDAAVFKKKQHRLKEALGARPLLVENGELLPQDSTSFSTVHHPRTALGIQGKNILYLVAVDGRQPEISNGISLTDLSQLMGWIGADDAVNLDGGGSTTMVVWDQHEKAYKVLNSPSDKELRPVANSWILVHKIKE